MVLKYKIKEEYIYTGAILILVILVFPFFFKMLRPNLKLYKTSLSEVLKKDKELKIRKATISQIQKLKQEISQIEDEYKSFIQKVILGPESSEAVRVITALIEGLKIEFFSFQPLPIQIQKIGLSTRKDTGFLKFSQETKGMDFFIWEIPVAIKIKANYANLLDFIKRIEDASRFISIKNIQITKDPTTPFVHNAEITVSMFSLPPVRGIK